MTVIVDTSTSATASAFSNQRKIARTSTGRIWTVFYNGTAAEFWYSDDGGATFAQNTFATITSADEVSLFIDADDWLHIAFRSSADDLRYRRSATTGTDAGFAWSSFQTVYQTTSADVRFPDLVVHREGTGWRVHVVNSRAFAAVGYVYYSRFDIASDGTTTKPVSEQQIASHNNGASDVHTWPSIDFNHTGDGKTVAGGTPHLYLSWSATKAGAGFGVRFEKATYSAGSWTWGTEREIDNSVFVSSAVYWVNCLFDGTAVIIGGYLFTGSVNKTKFIERDAGDTTTTVLADPGNTGVKYGSMSYDAHRNIHLIGFNDVNSTLRHDKWTRSTATRALVELATLTSTAPHISAKRGHSENLLEFIYLNGASSPFSVTYESITLNTAPNAPTALSPSGTTINKDITQRFSWVFSDPDAGDSQSKFDLRYRIVGAGTWTDISTTTVNEFHDFTAGTFAAGDYEWQVRTYDAEGLVGPYTSSAFFTAASAPAAATITDPISGGTIDTDPYTVTWSTPNQDAYQLRTVADAAGSPDTGTVYTDTGTIISSATRSKPTAFAVTARTEHVQLRIRVNGLWSTWTSHSVTVSYTPPATPTILVTPSDATASIAVAVDNGAWPVTISTVSYTGTGTGTMTGPTATDGVTDSRSWEAVCVTAAANGGTFDVKKDSVVVGQATVGTQFTHEGLSFTINDGATDFVVGDKFTWTTTAIKTTSNEVSVRVAAGGRQDIDRTVGDDGIRIATGVANGGTFTDRAVANSVDYQYRVKAIGANGAGSWSAWV